MTTTPTSGAADRPEALRSIQRFEVVDCIDDKHVPAVIPKPHGPWVRYEDHIAALAGGQATAAQQGVDNAALPTHSHTGRVYEEGFLIGTCPLYTADQMRAFADATHALRAPHGQAPAQPVVPAFTEAQIASACLSYRHDFGLLGETDRKSMMWIARQWERAFAKEREFAAPAQAAPAAVAEEPVHGDVLPPVGSRVFIRHGRDDDAHACIVTGYYAWGDLKGDKRLHRVFVRMVYEGTSIEQARMLCDCYPTAGAALAAAPTTQPAPDEIINMAREQGLPETETEGVFRVNVDDLGRIFASYRAARAPADSVLEDATFEAVRKKLCALPRYSFVLDDDGLIRRVLDRTGNWIAFDDAHELFDPVAVDAVRKQGAKHDNT